MTVKYNNNSCFTNKMLVDSSGNTSWHLGFFIPPIVPKLEDMDDYEIEAKYHLNPWVLAKDLYKSEQLYWIFAIVNPTIIDPLYDFKLGTVIKVPTASQVDEILGSR